MTPVETIPGMEGRELKENDRGGKIQLWYIIRTFVNVTMYPSTTIIKINIFLNVN
jgi:hypothetical protein